MPTYIRLKGQGVKEMDVCWLVPADIDASTSTSSRDTLICLELKGYQTWTIPADLLANLEQKAKDTLLMFCAAWLGRGQGSELALELPEAYRTYDPSRRLQLVILVDEDNRQAAALMALRQKLRNRLLGLTHLLDFSLTIVNRSSAERAGLPISAATPT
ncbi:hypothetical protein [Thiothrix lacustris]|uniref:hypothetical protein n=1 Tax=Thiothrix lacustris TaxID=525917 RepID=UPI0027E4DA85|nr:hypothetical protein [Thiothrix lacustris]WMP17091.1 hypothetical protein RCS87_17170 [Thiothrix lacustris]